MASIKKNILVVGGAGFIGSHVNKMLHQSGYNTIVFDNLSRGVRATVVTGAFVEGDMADVEALNRLFRTYKIDAVMHFAALTDVGESVTNSMLYYRNNVVNTLNLLEAMKQHHVDLFIFSSSAAIFGIPEKQRISESHPKQPINPYGETKLIVERMLADFSRSYGLRFCALRYFNAAGGDPEGEIRIRRKKENNLIPRLLLSLQQDKGEPVTIFGTDYPTPDNTCIRDYIHVSDLADAHILAMEKLFNGEKTLYYNLGNGNGFSVRQVVQAVEKVTGKTLHIIEGPRRPGDPPILVADCSKASQELGWHPKFPMLETIVEHAWRATIKESDLLINK